MHLLTKLLAVAWVGILGVLGADYAQVAGASSPTRALLNYQDGFVSPVSVLGAVTVLWVLVDYRLGVARRRGEHKAILRDKPGLAGDRRALERERKIRAKEAKLQKEEERTLRREDREERKKARVGARETKLERKREGIEAKKQKLQRSQQAGRR